MLRMDRGEASWSKPMRHVTSPMGRGRFRLGRNRVSGYIG
jgi:hypothetical protein